MTSDLTKTHYVEAEDIYITPRGRINFVALAKRFKSRQSAKDSEGQFVLSLCFPPNADLKPLKQAANAVAKEKFGADLFTAGKSKGVKNPFLKPADKDVVFPDPENGDEPMDLTNWSMLRTNSSKRRPIVRNAQGETIDVEDLETEAYSGRWARAMVRPASYDVEGKGVKFYLEGVQLLKHDKPIGSAGGTTGEAFGAVDDEDGDVDPLG